MMLCLFPPLPAGHPPGKAAVRFRGMLGFAGPLKRSGAQTFPHSERRPPNRPAANRQQTLECSRKEAAGRLELG